MKPQFQIEVFNITKNEWETFDTADTADLAFVRAEKAVGLSKDHDEIQILNPDGSRLWTSDHPDHNRRKIKGGRS